MPLTEQTPIYPFHKYKYGQYIQFSIGYCGITKLSTCESLFFLFSTEKILWPEKINRDQRRVSKYWSTGTGCQEMLWSFLPWRYSRPCVTYCRGPALAEGLHSMIS